ncbi:MAG: hypothetical protein A2Z18_09885 [Armatimonadetes bacterium RBG_16_58_9]|nr:MAG: hypothetical protein A2Z18_09885 [Armatimonadetes bacterium RBG_16_58_9]
MIGGAEVWTAAGLSGRILTASTASLPMFRDFSEIKPVTVHRAEIPKHRAASLWADMEVSQCPVFNGHIILRDQEADR